MSENKTPTIEVCRECYYFRSERPCACPNEWHLTSSENLKKQIIELSYKYFGDGKWEYYDDESERDFADELIELLQEKINE